MIGDWIKIRTDLYRDPKVIFIADELMNHNGELARYVSHNTQCDMAVTRNMMRNVTVGALVSVWGVTRHRGHRDGDDLKIKGATPSVVDDISDIAGFGDAMIEAGWLVDDGEGLVFPRFFARNNVDPQDNDKAKARERQRKHRAKKRNVTVTQEKRDVTHREEERRGEKRREEKRTTEPGGTLPRDRNRTIPQPTNPKPKRAGALGSGTDAPSPSVSEQEISGGGGSVSVSEQQPREVPLVLRHPAHRQIAVVKIVELFAGQRVHTGESSQTDADVTTIKRIVDHVIVGSDADALIRRGDLIAMAKEKYSSRLRKPLAGFVKACRVKWGPWPGHKDWRPP